MPDSTTSNPPKIAIKLANTVFVLGVVSSVLISVYAIYIIIVYFDNDWGATTFHTVFIAVGLISAILFSFGLRIKDNLKANLSLAIVIVGITLYAFETYLEFSPIQGPKISDHSKWQSRQLLAEKMRVPYDSRTRFEVIEDLRKDGVKAYPDIQPNKLVSVNNINTNNRKISPLGGISNHTTVMCQESGYWAMYKSDEHGFNNPKGLYEIGQLAILLTGDSFTQGQCVKPSKTIAAVLRTSHFNTISVGMSGNGPLLQMAAVKEYAEPLKPKFVLWLYYKNDLSNLESEMTSSILRKYLNDDDFSQNLISRQKEIDSMLIDYVEEKMKEIKEPIIENKVRGISLLEFVFTVKNRAISVLLLDSIRSRINLKGTPTQAPVAVAGSEFAVFKKTLTKSKQMVLEWGGRMYFVYLPSFYRYATGNEDVNREFILRTATELDIPIIDISKEVFEPHPDPLSLFPFRMRGHYTEKGYHLVAEAIAKRLRADEVLQ